MLIRFRCLDKNGKSWVKKITKMTVKMFGCKHGKGLVMEGH